MASGAKGRACSPGASWRKPVHSSQTLHGARLQATIHDRDRDSVIGRGGVVNVQVLKGVVISAAEKDRGRPLPGEAHVRKRPPAAVRVTGAPRNAAILG